MLIVAGIAALVGFILYGYLLGGHLLILGIALALAGVFCLVNPAVVKGILTVIFGIFVVVDGSVSIADSIVTDHHGKIWAESAGGINTFFVSLPTAQQ